MKLIDASVSWILLVKLWGVGVLGKLEKGIILFLIEQVIQFSLKSMKDFKCGS